PRSRNIAPNKPRKCSPIPIRRWLVPPSRSELRALPGRPRMTTGIVGAGQLRRMLALAGYPLGLEFLFLDRDARTPGGQVAPLLAGELTDRKLLGQLSERCE